MIDKNIPMKLVSDKDERLIQQGEMTQAENVTITQRGEGGGSIVKTAKGWKANQPKPGEDAQEVDITLIGSVSIEETDKVYMFFATTGSGHDEDQIIEYDASDHKWRRVFKNTWLNFDVDSFVSANAIVKAFQQDGVTKTMLYWTDNVNPPRKLNVDRAIDGDFDSMTTVNLDFALNVIKAAPVTPPLFDFTTNTNYQINNFERTTLQFAVQWIYKDGEVSAVGPYSKLAFPDHIAASGLEADESGQLYFTDNQCNIDIRKTGLDLKFPDEVSKVRLLGTRDNGTTAFIIDEFNPRADISKPVMNVTTDVYTADTGIYVFLNEGVYQVLGNEELNKLYDNVPLKAEAQTIVGNRLMYANYEEGRPNTETKVALTPRYSDEQSGGSVLISTDDTVLFDENLTTRIGNNDNFYIEWDFLDVGSFSADTDIVPGGTLFSTSARLTPSASIRSGSATTGFNALAYILTGSVTHDGITYNVGIGRSNESNDEGYLDVPHLAAFNKPLFNTSIGVPEDTALSAFVDLFHDEVAQFFNGYTIERTIPFNAGDTKAEVYYAPPEASDIAQGDSLNLNGGSYKVVWKFDVSHPDSTTVRVKPYVSTVTSNNLTLGGSVNSVTYSGTFGSDSFSQGFGATTGQHKGTTGAVLNIVPSASKSMRTFASKSTFKAGCSHELGIVYYDKYNRSSFVNKLGSFYVKAPGERSAGERGIAAVNIDWNSNYPAPDWAERYQIVYGGMSSYESYIQYTTGRAFVPRKEDYTVEENNKQIYVKLDTINNYRDKKGAVINYSYTEGDKLRVIKYSTNGGTDPGSDLAYPMANDGKTLVEFNVVGVVELGSSNNPIAPGATPGIQHKGTFIILEQPQIAAGIQSQSSSTQELKYPGWDYFSVAKGADSSTVYPDGTSPNAALWGYTSVVEILTPKRSEDRVWYEIGESHKVGVRRNAADQPYDTNHGPSIKINGGDSYLRTTAASTPRYEVGFKVNENPSRYVFKNIEIESLFVSDFFASDRWSRGRAHTTFENAATVNRYNSITYSDAYIDEVSKLSLSSFNLSLGNFFDLPSENGACRVISPLVDKLAAVQENKVSVLGVNKGVIETGSQDGFVTLSSNVLQNILPFGGDYGTKNPESVLVRDGAIYFGDASRRAIVKATMQGLSVISDRDIKALVESEFDSWSSADGDDMFSGYDPEDNIYYFTLYKKGSFAGFTVSWDEKREAWGSTHTFYGHGYATIKNEMIAGNYSPATDTITRRLTDDSVLSLNGAYQESSLTIVANDNPSMVKAYESVSTESDDEWTVSMTSSTGQTTGNLTMVEKEDAYYAMVTGDTSANSTAQYILIGKVSAIDGDVVTINGNLKGVHIPKGYSVYKYASGAYVDLSKTVSSVDRANKKVTVSAGGTAINVGDNIFVATTGQRTGDQIRGHYCKIQASYTPATTTDKSELYSINAKYAESRANHRRG